MDFLQPDISHHLTITRTNNPHSILIPFKDAATEPLYSNTYVMTLEPKWKCLLMTSDNGSVITMTTERVAFNNTKMVVQKGNPIFVLNVCLITIKAFHHLINVYSLHSNFGQKNKRYVAGWECCCHRNRSDCNSLCDQFTSLYGDQFYGYRFNLSLFMAINLIFFFVWWQFYFMATTLPNSLINNLPLYMEIKPS